MGGGKHMMKVTIIFSIIIFLVTCQGKSNPIDSFFSGEPVETTITQPINSVQELMDDQTIPSYIEEDIFLDEQLEIVKKINSRVQYLWEDNKDEYMKLINENSPLQSYPSYKIEKIELRNDISIIEHNNAFQAIVSVTEKRLDDNEEYNPTYVFTRDKKDGADWTFLDID